ncbi:MAG: enoyl-CoA hydratase/isomerase family protein [Candidatus Rokubacteria bacterium]|nr:enoyl-CoA hydratase/isomerase family protein [Candidatus Rokubacteria bacterium]
MSDLEVSRADGVVTLTLNRPERRNALSTALGHELLAALRGLALDDAARVLVLTGAGKAFCAGGDFADIQAANADPLKAEEGVGVFLEVFRALREIPFPSIARTNGDAVGGGCCLALGCDLKIAGLGARLALPFVNIGLAGADLGASYMLPRLVGLTRATEMLLLGQTVTAAEAAALGMIHRAVEPEALDREIGELAQRLARGPRLALRLTKQALAAGLDRGLEEALAFERYAQTLAIQSPDVLEGVRAFIEKRPPRFGAA